MKILLVEDNELILDSTAELLRAMGHTVFEAADAEHGMLIVREAALDVLFVDVGLPGESGDVFAAEARRVQPLIGVVFATGMDHIPDPGASDSGTVLLRKPYDVESIAAALRAVCP